MKRVRLIAAGLLAVLSAAPVFAKEKKPKPKVERETIQLKGVPRFCYYQIPATDDPKAPLPTVVLVHDQNNYATQVTKYWHDYAAHEGFIIVAPQSLTFAQWSGTTDGPDLFHGCVDAIDKIHPVDRSRIYIFGDTGGGVYTMAMALYDSTYYAAAAVHEAVMDAANFGMMNQAQRKIPIAMWMGDRDPMLSINIAQNEENAFKAKGFPFFLHVMSFTSGGYEGSADVVNEGAWKFFKQYQLPGAAGAAPAAK